ncbi:unnamed protein product [Leptosia nina]|uniref:Ankyrin repeat domain-containing protein n=1 Tax=Leptosia nina TaxID=320188 RepID=A0AAV1K291_9NEOP
MPVTEQDIIERFPLHWLVWHNNHQELQERLQNNEWNVEDIEKRDPRGRTPLLLAVTLGRVECTRALLNAGANVNCDKDNWTAVHEATARGNATLLSMVLARRDHARHVARARGVPDLLRRLSLTPDFYVELKWDVSSWLPLVTRQCPSDTYRVYKRGANVRVDSTLLGYQDDRWTRGDRTYIFSGHGDSAKLIELNHVAGTVWSEWVEGSVAADQWPAPSRSMISRRLRSPIHLSYLDTDKICFERNKSGIWGWRQDKTELVNKYECKVFSANNVEIVHKMRMENVPRGKRFGYLPPAPIYGFLPADSDHPAVQVEPPPGVNTGDAEVSWEEYFDESVEEPDIGRYKEVITKEDKFKGTLWLCEDYPLEFQEQIMPILDLIASMTPSHFSKLRDFIQMQLPSGFPVKIQFPLFHIVTARFTFVNLFGQEKSVPHVECIQEGSRLTCIIDDACFSAGRGYRAATPHIDDRQAWYTDDDEELLHYAIQQSLMEAGTQCDQVDVWEALRGARPATPTPPAPPPAPPQAQDDLVSQEQTMLQRAIEESLRTASVWPITTQNDTVVQRTESEDAIDGLEDELKAALALSAAEQQARDALQQDEQRALDEALRLSLLDK